MKRAFEQVAPGDRTSDVHSLILGGGATHLDGNLLARPFRVGDELASKIEARGQHGAGELVVRHSDPRCSAREEQHGVVGREAAVGVDPVEAEPGRPPERPIEVIGLDHSIGREDTEHRG